MRIGAIFIGIAFVIGGVWLAIAILMDDVPLFLLIYSLLLIIIGVSLVIFNSSEEKIEERKDLIKKKS